MRTISFDPDDGVVVLIDQTRLPLDEVYPRCCTLIRLPCSHALARFAADQPALLGA